MALKAHSFTIYLEPADYEVLRRSATFVHGFSRDLETGDVTFKTYNPRKLAADLEKLIDFGATTASDVLNLLPAWVF